MSKKLPILFLGICSALISAVVQAQIDVTATGGTANASYTTLKEAFDAINAGTHTGTITIGISGNSIETTSAVLNASGNGASSYASITISPTGGAARTISGSIAGPLIDLNGADNVLIDGLNTGGNSLTIDNILSAGTPAAIRFITDATNNTIQNCTIKSAETSSTLGTIFFSTGTSTGNDGNFILNNTITSSNPGFAANGIYSLGSSASIDNSGNVISGNNISDYFNASVSTSGITLGSPGNSAWTITNNKLFQTANRVYTTANTHSGIIIVNGSGYTITGNTIGFANTSGTGTTNMIGLTSGSLGGTFPTSYTSGGTANATRYVAIYCGFTAGDAASDIQGNIIGGFALYTSSNASTTNGIWCGIAIVSGNANIGTTTGNTIGSTTGTGSIYTACTTNGGTLVGIYSTSANTVTIQNNTVGSVTAVGTTASLTGGFTGIDVAGAAGIFNISNNIIGNTTADNIKTGYTLTAGSLSNTGALTATTGAGATVFIRSASTGTTLTISGNTIRGLGTSSSAQPVTGIISSGVNTTSVTISSNLLGTSGLGWVRYAFSNSGTLTGINVSNIAAGAGLTITSNNIRGIVYSATGSGSHTYITWTHASATTDNINNNSFTNLEVNTTGSVTFLTRLGNMTSPAVENVNSNSIETAFNKGGSGGTVTFFFANNASLSGTTMNNNLNNFSNITVTGTTTIAGWNNQDGNTSTSAPIKNISNNTFTSINGGTGSITLLTVNYSRGTTCSNNTISAIISSGAITGISIGGSSGSGTHSYSSNTINTFLSQSPGGSITGITGGTSALVNINGNTISSLLSSGVSSTVSGIQLTGGTTANIYNNSINDLSGTGTSTPRVNGISSTGVTTLNVYNNKLYDFLESGAVSTTSPCVTGMLFSGGTTVTASNNLIGDLRATAASLTDAIHGISISSTTANSTYKIYYNTIQINATSTGTNFGSSGIYHTASSTSTTASLDLRNNIIFNNAAPSGTGLTVAFRRSAGTAGMLANYASLSNNNDFYAGTPGANRLIYYDGTSSAQTITDYKNGAFTAGTIAPRDMSSVLEDPEFQSVTGSSANFLKFKTSSPKQIESGAANITSFTDDYGGTIRQGNAGYSGTGIAPDIGAWELEGIPLDLSGPSISYTNLGNVICTLDRTLSPVTITDNNNVNTSPGTKPRLYYKKSTDADTYTGNTSADNGWKFVEASNASSPFSFTTDYSKLQSPVSGSDVIQYFVVAQDIAATPNVSINSGSFASAPSTVALTSAAFPISGSINSYSLIPALSGTVNVGPGQTYPTLTGAGGLFAAINASGLSDHLTAIITGDINTETGANVLNAINYGCAGSYTLTIKPGTGINATISGSYNTSLAGLITLNGADYVTIDGSNNGTNSRNLTITNTYNNSSLTIFLKSTGANAGATNNTIKNCNISCGVDLSISTNNESTIAILVGHGTYPSTCQDNDNNTFQNNFITKASYGINIWGESYTNPNQNISILDNIIGPASFGTDEIGRAGIILRYTTNTLVSGNEIRSIGGTYALLPAGGNITISGIELATGCSNSVITRNKIHDVVNEKSGSAAGISISDDNNGSPTNNLVANNMIHNIHSNNAWAGHYGGGMIINSGDGDKVVFNSIFLSGNIDPYPAQISTRSSAAVFITSSSVLNLTFKNNAIHADVNSENNALKHYGIIVPSPTFSWGTGNSNNNIFYVNPSNPQMVLGGTGVSMPYTNITTLSGWKTLFTPNQDANSSGLNPGFMSATDLHINPAMPTPVESGGISIAGITNDFDGDPRSATPDIGADEAVLTPALINDTKALVLTDPVNGAYKPNNAAFMPAASFMNMGTSAQSNLPVRYRIVGPSPSTTEVYNQTGIIASLNSSETVNFSFPSTTISVAGTYTVYARTELPGDANTSNDEISGTMYVAAPLCGTYAVGASQPAGFQNLTQAFNQLNCLGISCPVVYELQADYSSAGETLPLTINEIAGAGPVNTFTLRPATGVTATINGEIRNAIIKLYGADYVTIDGSNNGSNSRNLTITNLSTINNTSAVWFYSLGTGQGATNNTIKNCNISCGIDGTATYNGENSYIVGVLSGNISTLITQPEGNDNNYNSILNNEITKARIGIKINGNITTTQNTGWTISNNTIGPATYGPDAISAVGIQVLLQDNINITGNDLRNIGMINHEIQSEICGIMAGYYSIGSGGTKITNAVIKNNKLTNIFDENGSNISGIALQNVNTTTTPTNNIIANNFISNIRSNLSYGQYGAGIFIESYGNSDKILHNTISLTGDLDPPSSNYSAIYPFSGIRINSTTSTNLSIFNNLINGDLNSDITSLKHCAIKLPSSSFNFGTGGMNYNNYYINPANTQMVTGIKLNTTYSTLASWQTAVTPQDANSANIQPVFVSSTDLHLSSASGVNCTLDGKGTPVAAITTDYDGQPRNTVVPDIGADEYSASPSGLAGTIGGASVCSNVTVDAFGTNYKDGSCKGIVKITPSGGSPVSGAINSCVTIDAAVQSYSGHAYMQRHFDITPAVNQSTATARITLYALQSEFNSYNSNNGTDPDLPTGPADASGIANLRVLKFSGNGIAPGNYVPGVETLINPGDADIVWDAVNNWWTITFDVTGFSGFYIQSGAGTLPVTLLNFSGYRDGSRNQLKWTTANEQNCKGFEVQRSLNGINYTSIGFVNSLAPGGNSSSELNYTYTDNNVTGNKQYYRLNQVDLDGRSKYSNIVLIKSDKPVNLDIDGLFPNPASTLINVLIASPNKDKVKILLMDVTGRTVAQQMANVETGMNTIPVDISRLSNGTYLVKLVCNNSCENAIGKFIKE